MKKILICLTPILMIILVFGCSKDHSAPTFSVYKAASSPDSVVATYDAKKDIVNVTWSMSDTTGIIDYYVAVSDSNVFDYGKEKKGFFTNLAPLKPPYAFTYQASTFVPKSEYGDSLILYFNVSAVYKNEIFNGFIGPRAVKPGLTYGDSALVYRK